MAPTFTIQPPWNPEPWEYRVAPSPFSHAPLFTLAEYAESERSNRESGKELALVFGADGIAGAELADAEWVLGNFPA